MANKKNIKIFAIVAGIILVLVAVGVTLFLVLRNKSKKKPNPPAKKEREVFFAYYDDDGGQSYPQKTDLASWATGDDVSGRIANYKDLCRVYAQGSSVCAVGETLLEGDYHMVTEYVRNKCFSGQGVGVCKDTGPEGYFIYGYKPEKGASVKIGETSYTASNFIIPFRTEEGNKKYWFARDYTGQSKQSSAAVAADDCSCQRIPPDRSELIMVKTTGTFGIDITKWATPLGYYPVSSDKLCDAYKNGYETCGNSGISSGIPWGKDAVYNEIGQNANITTGCVKGVCTIPEPKYTGVFIYYTKPQNPTDIITFLGHTGPASTFFYPWSSSKWSKYSAAPKMSGRPGAMRAAGSDCGCTRPPTPTKEVFFAFYDFDGKHNKYPNQADLYAWAVVEPVQGVFSSEQDLCQAYKQGASICTFGSFANNKAAHVADTYVRDVCFTGQGTGVCLQDIETAEGFFITGFKPKKDVIFKIGTRNCDTTDFIVPFRTEGDEKTGEEKKYWFSQDYTGPTKPNCDCTV